MRLPAPARKSQSAADRAAGRLLPRALTLWRPQPDWRLSAAESIALMALAIALSVWVRPHDPFWTGVGFPWLWLIPTLVALRYGALLGVVVLGVALAAWFGLSATGGIEGEFPRVSFLGALVLVLVAGEFADVWAARLNQAQAINAYVDERLQVLTHNHFLLSVSHDQLEQELIARPYTLRETLSTLRRLVLQQPARRAAAAKAPDAATPAAMLPGAAGLMGLLVQQCQLEAAALFTIADGHLDSAPAAAAGTVEPLDTADPMLVAALEGGQLTHLQSNLDLDLGFGDRVGSPSRYQVCAPLITSGGRMLGVLVVERMAFVALNAGTLQLLTVVLAYYADGVDHAANAAPVLARYPQCPLEFAAEWANLSRIYAVTSLDSSIVAFSIAAENVEGVDALSRIERLRRSLDYYWPSSRGRRRVLLAMLPLTDLGGLRGYVDRVETLLRDQTGRDLEALGMAVFSAAIDERPALLQLDALMERVDA